MLATSGGCIGTLFRNYWVGARAWRAEFWLGGFTIRLLIPDSKAARFSGYLSRSNGEGIWYLLFTRPAEPFDLVVAGDFACP